MGKDFISDSPVDEILRMRTKHTYSVEVIPDAEKAAELKAMERQLDIEKRKDNKLNRSPVAPGLKKKIDLMTEELSETAVEFVFQDLGRKKFEDLWKQFPPSDELRELGYQWDPDSFGPPLLAASCIKAGGSDGLTLEQAQTIYDDWSTGEAEALVMGAINANMGVSSIPKSEIDIDAILSSDLSSTIASNTESPTASS